MSRVLNAARAYIGRGYYVFPVTLTATNGKKDNPRFPGHWSDSTNDPSKVEELFSDAAGIAIDTGKSGVVVIDVDVSGDKDGFTALGLAGIDLPATPMITDTWSGGSHYFFKQPAEPIGSASNRPVKAVDHRGTGGVVFAAPTVVTDSSTGEIVGSYEINQLIPVDQLPVLPESYATLLRAAKPVERKPVTASVPPTLLRTDQRAVLEDYVHEDVALIEGAGSGERNDVLGRTTFRLADRCQKLGYEFEQYQALVLDAYRESGGEDEDQALNWCRSSWAKVHESPFAMPRTEIDRMADERHARMVADRLARQKLNGESVRFIDETSFVDWLEEPPEPQYWVQGVIPQGEQVVLYGRPEAGKTFLGLDWSLSIASGRQTFGHSTTQGRVLYMSGEGNARITSRIHAWMEYHGVRIEPSRFALTNHVPDLMHDQVIEQLARRVADEEFDVVFIDTLGRAMSVGGGDISTPADTAVALKNLQAISRYRTSTTPIVLHHPIKDGTMAGAYNLLGGVDVSLFAEVDEDTHEGTLSFAKNKDGEKGVIQQYRWQKQGRSAVLVPTLEYTTPDAMRPSAEPGRIEREMHEDPFGDGY